MLLSTGPPSLNTRLLHILVIAGILYLFVHTRHLYQDQAYQGRTVAIDLAGKGGSSPELQYLARVQRLCDLSNETSWMAWKVSHSESQAEWMPLTEVPVNFQSLAPRIIDVQNPNAGDLQVKKTMDLPTHIGPRPGQVDASDLLLGVSTSFSRVAADDFAMIAAWTRWLTNGRRESNGASLIVMLDQAQDPQVTEIDRRLQASGIDAYVTTTEEPMSLARRYFELARILKTFGANLAANGQQKRWFGLIEDDIFFPSLSYLMDRLLSYNSEDRVYIGLPSERDDWEMDGASMTTYGGGAVFFSRVTITEVPRLPCFGRDSSGLPIRAKNWDVLLQDCIAKHTGLPMHVLPGFFSPTDRTYKAEIDSYETGVQPLLLRHIRDRHTIDINKAHLVTDVCGEACFMQRYAFHDNWVLVNGVSITEFPGGLKFEKRALDTFEDSSTVASAPEVQSRLKLVDDGIQRGMMNWKGEKNTWKLVDAAIGKTGAVWQAYVKKAPKATSLDAMPASQETDSVIVLIWDK